MTRASARRLLLVASMTAAASAGCLEPNSVSCSDGRVCPAGTRCDVVMHDCITVAAQLACIDRSEGEGCFLGQVRGMCRSGACRALYCGDGVRTGGEDCDGSDFGGATCTDLRFYGQTTGLRCTPDCTFDTSGCEGACGDGVKNGSELCDGNDLGGADCTNAGFYEAPGLACSPFCTFDVSACSGTCGDAIANGPEECDGAPPNGQNCLDAGFDRGLLGCSAVCGQARDGCARFGWSNERVDVNLLDLWGSGLNDVFAVGYDGYQGAVIHWDGKSWSRMTTDPTQQRLSAVWGNRSDDVFALASIGTATAILHWDGNRWSTIGTSVEPIAAIWSSGPNDLFAVGQNAMHWDGKTWATTSLPSAAEAELFQGVWGSGSDDVFAVGSLGTIVHWDGATWSVMRAAGVGSAAAFVDVWGSAADDVFAVGGQTNVIVHWDGVGWSEMPVTGAPAFQSIWGSRADDVLALATDSSIWRWDGKSWSTMGRAPFGNRFTRPSVWGSGGELIVVDGGARVLRWDGTTWAATEKAASGKRVYSVWRNKKDDFFGLMTDDAYAIGSVGRWNGESWATLLDAPQMRFASIWASGPGDVFAVGRETTANGDSGVIVHWDGTSWAEERPGIEQTFNSVWGSGRNDVFAVGTGGAVEHWNGGSWTLIDAGTRRWLTSVWGSGGDDVFAVGEAGTVVHWDGRTWTAMESGTTDWLFCVWGTGRTNAFAVGRGGTILRWNGVSWTRMRSGTSADLALIRGGGAGDVFVAGGDTLLHLRAGAWEPIAHPADNPIQEVSVDGGRVLMFGGGMTRLARESVTCAGPEQDCRDGWDNDCDGLQDAADPDCAGMVAEQCANGVDDDADGKTDCADPNCARFPSCTKR